MEDEVFSKFLQMRFVSLDVFSLPINIWITMQLLFDFFFSFNLISAASAGKFL